MFFCALCKIDHTSIQKFNLICCENQYFCQVSFFRAYKADLEKARRIKSIDHMKCAFCKEFTFNGYELAFLIGEETYNQNINVYKF